MDEVDIKRNREERKYSEKEILARVIWSFGIYFFKFSPRIFFRWRNFVLRVMGAKIGNNVRIYSSSVIYMPWNLEIEDWVAIGENALIYNLGKVIIKKNATISQRAHLCGGSHDYELVNFPLRKSTIVIGAQSWICSDSFIGPGVIVGEGAVVGAAAVVTKNVDPWTVVAGNPATFIKKRILRKE